MKNSFKVLIYENNLEKRPLRTNSGLSGPAPASPDQLRPLRTSSDFIGISVRKRTYLAKVRAKPKCLRKINVRAFHFVKLRAQYFLLNISFQVIARLEAFWFGCDFSTPFSMFITLDVHQFWGMQWNRDLNISYESVSFEEQLLYWR